ncbi:Protein YigP clustered withubiquinone biosynthetic genes [Salmonella enterica subsp. enterica]|uniref:Protein YigP clustered withubiquinone biosynthetic genes n=1 Tax=Salmonella enterica I TaxID=59201 RepID=A0A379WIL2_SALET|nr:Protein YigP clustered withubiquinone biosynthetic genes [Salmonella enterica subsp. enterica]
MPFKPLVTAGIEGLLNTFLYRSPALKSARTRLQGKVLCVKLKGFSTPLVLVFSERQVDVLGAWEGEADCTVITQASVLPKLRDRQQLAALIRSGELEVQAIFRSCKILWRSPISPNSILRSCWRHTRVILRRKVSVRPCVAGLNSCATGFNASSVMPLKRSLKSGVWRLARWKSHGLPKKPRLLSAP